MAELATFTKRANVGIVTLNNPPVNALSHALRVALQAAFNAAIADADVEAILLHCDGRTFVAGADIREFGKAPLRPDVNEIVEWVAESPKPVTAALHGTALGGGVELALACHFRVAAPDAKVGFPEVGLGILPGAGGTQRLPRLVGVRAALDMVVGGAPISASKARDLGMVDALIEGDLLQGALSFVQERLAEKAPWGKVSERKVTCDDPGLFEEYERSIAEKSRGFLAPSRCIQAIRAAVELPFDEGLKRERELFLELMNSSQSKAQRHAFFGEREVSRSPRLPSGVPGAPIRAIAVVGSNSPAVAIATDLSRRIPTTFVALGAPVEGELSEVRQGRFSDVQDAAVVIVAAAGEQLDKALAELDSECAPGAVIAIRADDVNLTEAASRTKHPERVLGLNFEGSRLMEVIAVPTTGAPARATAMELGKALRKVAIFEEAQRGSASARLRDAYQQAAVSLMREGAPSVQVARVLSAFGFRTPALPATGAGIEGRKFDDEAISRRCVYAMINEGARLLEDAVLARALEVDMIAMHGHGFPLYLGGPLFYADQFGLERVCEELERLATATGNQRWKPASSLARLLKEGRGFYP